MNRADELRSPAQRIAAALPVAEVVLTVEETDGTTVELVRDAVALVGPEIDTEGPRAWLYEAVAEPR